MIVAVKRMIVVVDLGSHKFRAAAFEGGRLLATDDILSGYWHPNNTEDILYARERIEVLVKRLEGITAKIASEIVLVFSGSQVSTLVMQVMTRVAGAYVTERDKMSLIALALKALNNRGMSSLGIAVASYQINNGKEMQDPIGVQTPVVKAKCIVSAQSKAMYNKWMSIFQAHYPNKEIRLTSAEKFVGCYADTQYACVLNIGNTSKTYIVENGNCNRSFGIPCSCDDITEGITDRLVPKAVREKVKNLYCEDDGNDIFVQFENKQSVFSRNQITSIVHANATKVIERLIDELRSIGVCDRIQQLIIIGGGAALMTEVMLDGIMKAQLNYPGSKFKQVVIPRYKFLGENYGPEWGIVFAVGFNCNTCEETPGFFARCIRYIIAYLRNFFQKCKSWFKKFVLRK